MSVSQLEDRKHRHMSRPLARNLVSDDDLRYLVGRRYTTALHVMLYVRKRAALKGRLQVAVTNVELEKALGVDRRAIQRAKAHLRECGFPIEERVGRHQGRTGKSGSLACMFVLDRREVEGLKPRLQLVRDESHGGAVLDAVHVRDKNNPPSSTASPMYSKGGLAAPARDGPHLVAAASDDETEGQPATAAERALERARAGWPERLSGLPAAAELEPELTQLREWVSAARGSALSGERATALLDRAVEHVERSGGRPFTARLARTMLERELGAGQLSIGSHVEPVPRSSERPNVNVVDACGSDEGTAAAPIGEG